MRSRYAPHGSFIGRTFFAKKTATLLPGHVYPLEYRTTTVCVQVAVGSSGKVENGVLERCEC